MARLRGFLWLTAGLVVALVAAGVAFTTLSQATEAQTDEETATPKVEVVVAARSVPVRTVLTEEDLQLAETPLTAVPESALRSIDDAVGQMTLADLFAGEIVISQRLMDPNVVSENGRKALMLVEEEVLMALPAQDLLSRIGFLKPGDKVDVLFSLDFPVSRLPNDDSANDREEQATFSVLENLTVAALVGETANTGSESEESDAGKPDAVLLTVKPQDALVLKHVMDAGGALDLVLRAPGMDGSFDADPVDIDYMINRYGIPHEVGR